MDDTNFPEGTTADQPADEPVTPAVATPTPWGIAEVVLGIFLTFLCGLVFALIFSQVASDPDRMTLPRLVSGLAPAWIGYGLFAVLIARNHPGGIRQQLGFRFDLKRDIPKGVVIGILGQVLAALVYVPIKLIWPGSTDSLSDPATSLTEALSSWRWVVFALFVGVIAPINEELFFRGFTLRAISSRFGTAIGIFGSALIFGLIHVSPLQTVALATFGLLLAWRATRTGRIGETVIAHGVFNLITIFALIMRS